MPARRRRTQANQAANVRSEQQCSRHLIDQRHGGPITIGYGRYGANQSLEETIAVDDVMVVLEGRLSVSTNAGTVTAGPGEIVYMPKGESVTIRSHEQGAITAYVTYPHWQEAHT